MVKNFHDLNHPTSIYKPFQLAWVAYAFEQVSVTWSQEENPVLFQERSLNLASSKLRRRSQRQVCRKLVQLTNQGRGRERKQRSSASRTYNVNRFQVMDTYSQKWMTESLVSHYFPNKHPPTNIVVNIISNKRFWRFLLSFQCFLLVIETK